MAYRTAVKDEINKMLEMNIIKKSKSNFINPLVIVKKKMVQLEHVKTLEL